MDNYSIKLDDISKRYNIAAVHKKKDDFRDFALGAIGSPFRKLRGILKGQASAASGLDQVFWALKDISFEIHPGETVGLIGSNGAGKSTLLKVLTRITEPSSGYGEIRGRVGSLLEVGTGFHPELTGRDNVFLNGSILGMTKVKIKSKLDEIIDFSGIEQFIDTPVKHYSSGMFVRLAFAVAANLEPEILLIDEVLAVGDARFQKKCLSKMDAIGETGRTIVFVSHNMAAVTRLCKRAILLKHGQIVDDGPSGEVVAKYMSSGVTHLGSREWNDSNDKCGDDIVQLLAVRVKDQGGQNVSILDIRNSVSIEMEFEVLQEGYTLLPHFHLINETGVNIMTVVDLDKEWQDKIRPKGIYHTTVSIPGNFFSECTIFVHANLNSLEPVREQRFSAPDAVAFQVVDTLEGDSARGNWVGPLNSIVRPAFQWQTEFVRSL